MAKSLVTMSIIAVACTALWGDQVRIKNLTYHSAEVLGAEKGLLRFRTSAGSEAQKPIAEVSGLHVEGRAKLNQAERLVAKGKHAEAVPLYRQALLESPGSLAKLTKYRLLAALIKSGPADETVALWLDLASEPAAIGNLLPFRPTPSHEAGSAANARAIALLESTRSKPDLDKDYGSAIEELLLVFYDHEGREEELAQLALQITGTALDGEGADGKTVPHQSEARFRALAALIGHGAADRVRAEVQRNLDQGIYGTSQLAWAFFLLGKAEKEMSNRATTDDGKRRLLVSAGLNLMRVVTFFPDSPTTAEALMSAGEVNASLGNADAARNAWRMMIASYPKSKAARTAEARMKLLRRQHKKNE